MLFMLSWLFLTIILGTLIAMSSRWLGYEIIIAGFVGMLVIAISVAGKLGAIPGLENFTLSASIFVYSATFIFTDVLSEIWGKEISRKAVYAGAVIYPLLFVTTQFSVIWQPHPVWAANQEAYAHIMGTTVRIVIASFVAFVVSQLHDVWSFHVLKRWTNGKHFWLRKNVSTIISQGIDTVVFYTIGFYGVFPVLDLILFSFAVKAFIAIVDTPFVHFVVHFLRKDPAIRELEASHYK